MIEFTLSRVVLMACGVAVLAVAMAAVDGTGDRIDSDLDQETADRIAAALDGFHGSVADECVLDPRDLLPSGDHHLRVEDNLVRLEHGGRVYTAHTAYPGKFTLSWGSGEIVLVKGSVAERLGDVPDGVGEHVDLLYGVVQVGRGAGAAVDAP